MPDSASLRPLLLAVLAFLASIRDNLATLTDQAAGDRLRLCDDLTDQLRAAANAMLDAPAGSAGQPGISARDLAATLRQVIQEVAPELVTSLQQLQQLIAAAAPSPAGGSENSTSTS